MSEASHGEHVEIVRRGLGQHFNATDAMAHLAKSKVVVILLMQTFFRVTANTDLLSEPGLSFRQRPQRGLHSLRFYIQRSLDISLTEGRLSFNFSLLLARS